MKFKQIFAEPFGTMCTIFNGPLGPPSIDNGAHGTEKPLLKTKSVKIWHNEVNPIIGQDQEGKKYQHNVLRYNYSLNICFMKKN